MTDLHTHIDDQRHYTSAMVTPPGMYSPRQYTARLNAARQVRSDRERVWFVTMAMYELRMGTLERRQRWGDELLAHNPVSKAILDVIYSATTLREPEIAIVDAGKLSEGAAAASNYWYRRHKMHRQTRLMTRDALIMGCGWLKAGWVHADRPGQPDPGQAAALAQGAYSAAVAMSQSDPAYRMPDLTRLNAEASAWLAERTPPEVTTSHPRLNRVSPWDMWVDPEATSLDDARWVCQRVWEPVAAVRNNPMYDEAARALAKPTVIRVADESNPNGGTINRYGYTTGFAYQGVGSHGQGRVAVYEMWDVEEGIVAKWADTSNAFLSVKAMPYELPYEHVTMYELPDKFYGMGELEPLFGLQDEINEMLTIDLAHRRQQIAKFAADEAIATDPRVSRLMKSSQVGVVIPIKPDELNRSIRERIVELAQPRTSAQIERSELRAQENMRTVSGVNEFHDAGQPLKTHQTATAVAAREDAMNMRSSEKTSILERAVISIVRKILGQAQLMLSKPVRARSSVRSGGDPMVIDRAMIAAVDVYDVRVEIGSMAPVDKSSQLNNFLFAVNTLAANPVTAQYLDGQAIAKETMARVGIENSDMLLRQPQDQMMGAGDPLAGVGGPTPALPSGGGAAAPPPV